ncbi:hypothetical protein HMPREF3102_09665 [Micrococcus sp. HMSC30C05]|nr:hypothetical protein HMPREF3102_09665 [Micrococcus sp. HMSC30C05]
MPATSAAGSGGVQRALACSAAVATEPERRVRAMSNTNTLRSPSLTCMAASASVMRVRAVAVSRAAWRAWVVGHVPRSVISALSALRDRGSVGPQITRPSVSQPGHSGFHCRPLVNAGSASRARVRARRTSSANAMGAGRAFGPTATASMIHPACTCPLQPFSMIQEGAGTSAANSRSSELSWSMSTLSVHIRPPGWRPVPSVERSMNG